MENYEHSSQQINKCGFAIYAYSHKAQFLPQKKAFLLGLAVFSSGLARFLQYISHI